MDLERYRKNKDLTYDELAKILDVKVGTLFRACKKTGSISLETAHKIVHGTGGVISFSDLLTRKGDC